MASVSVATRDIARFMPAQSQPNHRSADVVLKAFNTWAFKREQPCNIDLLQSFTSRAVRQEEPLSFVTYWGKGSRDELAEPELQCLQYLKQMMSRIDAVHKPGTELHLVMTDSHAKLNGHKSRSINKYFKSVEAAGKQCGFSSWRLQSLTDSMRPALKMVSNTQCDYPKEVLVELEKSAAKWYRGSKSTDVGARRYYEMNMVERRVIERVFPNSIFLTFNSSDVRSLFPDKIPVFYMYSTKKGVGTKPWFQ